MGGDGSGRKPNPMKAFMTQHKQPVNPQVCNAMVLPNLSGVKNELINGTHNIIPTVFDTNYLKLSQSTPGQSIVNTNPVIYYDEEFPPYYYIDPVTLVFGQDGDELNETGVGLGKFVNLDVYGSVISTDLRGPYYSNRAGLSSNDLVAINDFGFFFANYTGGFASWVFEKDRTSTNMKVYDSYQQSTFNLVNSHLLTTGNADVARLRATGAVDQTATGSARFDIGVQAGTPRMILEQAGYTPWQVDTYNGSFRWFQPGIAFFYITPNATPANGAYSSFGGAYPVSWDTAAGLATYGQDIQVVRNTHTNGKGQFGYAGTTDQRSYAILDLNTSSSKGLSLMDSTNGGLLLGYTGATIQARTPANANTQDLLLQPFAGSINVGPGTAPVYLNGINLTMGGTGNSYYVATFAASGLQTFIGSDSSGYGIVGTVSNHPVGFRTNNTERVRIDTSGRVGIGTTAPSVKLSFGTYFINSATPTADEQTSHIRFYDGGDGGINYGMGVSQSALNIAANQNTGTIRLFTNAVERLNVNADGNLKINGANTASTYRLESTGSGAQYWKVASSNSFAYLVADGGNTDAGYGFQKSGSWKWQFNNIAASSDMFGIYSYGVGAYVFNIDYTGGKVGIGLGTTAASAKLHAVSTTEQLRLGYDTSNYFSTTVGSTGTVTLNAVGSGAGFTFSDPITVPAYVRHIQVPALVTGNVSNSPTPNDYFTAGGLDFTQTGTKYCFFQWEVPDDWDGTDIKIEVDWVPTSGTKTTPDAVKWNMEYRALAEGELINAGTSVTLTNSDTATQTQYKFIHPQFTATYNDANQPLTKQDHMFFKVSRDNTVANNWAGTATVTAFEIIYNSTKLPTGG